MAAAIRYPLVVFYAPSCAGSAASIARLRTLGAGERLQFVESKEPGIRARDANGRWLVGIVALEAAYRAAY